MDRQPSLYHIGPALSECFFTFSLYQPNLHCSPPQSLVTPDVQSVLPYHHPLLHTYNHRWELWINCPSHIDEWNTKWLTRNQIISHNVNQLYQIRRFPVQRASYKLDLKLKLQLDDMEYTVWSDFFAAAWSLSITALKLLNRNLEKLQYNVQKQMVYRVYFNTYPSAGRRLRLKG